MQKDKVRIYAMARELNVESKDLLDLCRQVGLDVKNQLSSIDADQRTLVESLLKRGPGAVALATAPRTTASVIPAVSSPVPVLPTRRMARDPEHAHEIPPADEPEPSVLASDAPAERAAEPAPTSPRPSEASAPRPAATPPPAAAGPATPARIPDMASRGMRDLNQPRPDGGGGALRTTRRRDIPRPVVARVASPSSLKPRHPGASRGPVEPVAQKPIARPPMESLRAGQVNVQDILNRAGTAEVAAPADSEEDDDRKGKARPVGVAGRDKRHAQRSERARLRKGREGDRPQAGQLLVGEDADRPQRTKQRLRQAQQRRHGPTQPRKGKVPIDLPITVRSLSEAIGLRSIDLMFKLKDHGADVSINSALDPELAETLALDSGVELDIKRNLDAEDQILESLKEPDQPEDVVLRAPVVTIMGHVDHGKTSLLDKIRSSNVAATEAGGITQVIRAWRVDHGGRPITFLDTPGHEAFTKMRARGAQVTDIVVIVVAAEDGVMPQTEEAVNHAKAAEVPIVVAINKVDLPNANINRTRQQLYGLGLLPDNMGGDIPFIETSATTGKGIAELLDNISVVAETLLEQKIRANPSKPGRGTCLEAMLSEGEGVQATLLVQDGTLRRGDVLVCGAAYGRVRAMYDDAGQPTQEAGPSIPVRITGLDEVPDADDPFQVVPDLALAREVAEKRKSRRQESALVKREPVKLESLSQIKIAELKVILKADFRGSVEAIRKELEKLHHVEVRVRVLHAAIGGITESDVQLALTSPQDTIIVGFNVVPDDRAHALAEERGVQIRQYDIIYNLTDDIRSALEGKLKPREEVIHLGRAVVRNTFKISRVGTIAGCYVTQGTIERSAKVRLIRGGVVIYPPPDRTAGLESLKRFKDDVREVREGFECGLKIAGYDDIKVDDVVEAYRVEQIQRTL